MLSFHHLRIVYPCWYYAQQLNKVSFCPRSMSAPLTGSGQNLTLLLWCCTPCLSPRHSVAENRIHIQWCCLPLYTTCIFEKVAASTSQFFRTLYSWFMPHVSCKMYNDCWRQTISVAFCELTIICMLHVVLLPSMRLLRHKIHWSGGILRYLILFGLAQ